MDLYFSILDCANTAQWKKSFSVPNSTLMNLCQLSKTQLFNSRNQLIQLGLIEYSAGKKGQAGTYTVVPLSFPKFNNIPGTDFGNNSGNNSENINKGKKEINKNDKKSYRKNVCLNEEEYKALLEKYGEQMTENILNRLERYKNESGRDYRDDFAAINRWVADSVTRQSAPKKSFSEQSYEVYSEDYDHDELEKLTLEKL